MSRTQALTHVIFLTSLMMMMTACSKRFASRETLPDEKQTPAVHQRVVASATTVSMPDEDAQESPFVLEEFQMQATSLSLVTADPEHADTIVIAGDVIAITGAAAAAGTLLTGSFITGGLSGNLW